MCWLSKLFKEIKELCPSSKVDEGMNILFYGYYYTSELIIKKSDIKDQVNVL